MLTGGIGFFDSGVGGLTVLKECEMVTCGLPIYYYGDNQRAPYGNRPIYEMRAYVREAFEFFRRVRVAAAVVACNTVTALLIDELRREYDFPIVGVEPAVLPAAKECRRVTVLATKATCESRRLQELLERAKILFPNVSVSVLPCPKLAGEIEKGCVRGEWNVDKYLPSADTDGVVLGCTHYIFAQDEIEKFYGAKAFHGNAAVANRLSWILQNKGIKKCSLTSFDHFCTPTGKLSALSFIFARKTPKSGLKKHKKLNENNVRFWKVKNAQSLYFVGSGRLFNRKFYERMFAFYKFQK